MNDGNSNARRPDIVIVGAGVMGASTIFHLARRKPGNIAVIDKDRAGRVARRSTNTETTDD
jgi:glycine/D-amino acid oxidase-like deaminating enzyme